MEQLFYTHHETSTEMTADSGIIATPTYTVPSSFSVWSHILCFQFPNVNQKPLALVVYDWLLCFDQEVKYMWNRRSGGTISLLVYAFSRYMSIINFLLGVITIYPMSDLVRDDLTTNVVLFDSPRHCLCRGTRPGGHPLIVY